MHTFKLIQFTELFTLSTSVMQTIAVVFYKISLQFKQLSISKLFAHLISMFLFAVSILSANGVNFHIVEQIALAQHFLFFLSLSLYFICKHLLITLLPFFKQKKNKNKSQCILTLSFIYFARFYVVNLIPFTIIIIVTTNNAQSTYTQ